MNFKLPSIHHLTNLNNKITNNNPSKYIHVLQGYAYVNHEIIAVNLREYIKIECDIEEEEDIEELDLILEWFEGKSFTKEFWEQLVKEQEVSFSDDSLIIQESSFTRNLHYQSVELDLRLPLNTISDNINNDDFSLYRVSFNGTHLALLQKAFNSELKRDHLNFELTETGKSVKFSLSSRNFIFGSIKNTDKSASDLMAFIEHKDFKEIVDERLTSLPPLPPSTDEEDIDSEKSEEENDGASFDPGNDMPDLFSEEQK